MKIEREKIVAKIRALLSKTVENGCTEHEALAALGMARAMMDAYEVQPEDIQLKGEEADILTATHDRHGIGKNLANAVAKFCGCKVWMNTSETRVKSLKFCGVASDVELAGWLLESLRAFVVRELARHLIGSVAIRGERRAIINGFTLGACARISKRLDDLTEQSARSRTSNGRALVIAKDGLILAKMASDKIQLARGRKSSRRADHGAYRAGQSAGDRASFGRPVSGGGGGGAKRLR